jgi:hypothetical protein
MLVGCGRGPQTEDLEAVDYTPLIRDDWKVSTPAEQGPDPMLVAELYFNAAKEAELDRLYGVLVVKNGYLIAEEYYNVGAVDRKNHALSWQRGHGSGRAAAMLKCRLWKKNAGILRAGTPWPWGSA